MFSFASALQHTVCTHLVHAKYNFHDCVSQLFLYVDSSVALCVALRFTAEADVAASSLTVESVDQNAVQTDTRQVVHGVGAMLLLHPPTHTHTHNLLPNMPTFD